MIRIMTVGMVIAGIILTISVVNCLLRIDAFRSPPQYAAATAVNASIAANPGVSVMPAARRPCGSIIIAGEDTLFTYSGLIHFHTTYSDGSGSYAEMATLAGSLGIDFIMPADHNTVKPFTDSQCGYRNGVLVIPAVEASADHGGGHFVIAGTDPPLVRSRSIPSDSVFQNALDRDLIVILAHVHHPRHNDWEDWDIGPFTGIEVFNLDENWRATLTPLRLHRLFAGFAVYPFTGAAIYETVSYPRKQLATFDRLNRERKVVGIGVTDAHSRLTINDDHIIRFPSYASAFSIVRTYLVTRKPYSGEYSHDRDLTLAAIKQGSSFTGFPVLADPSGFFFTAKYGDNTAIMGDSLLVAQGEQATIRCAIPDSTEVAVVVRRDGDIIAEFTDISVFSLTVGTPGAYRVEVFHTRRQLPLFSRHRFPFIISNPLYIYSPDAIAANPCR